MAQHVADDNLPEGQKFVSEAQCMQGYYACNTARLAGAPLGSSGPSDHHDECRVLPGVLQDACCCVPIICVAEPILSTKDFLLQKAQWLQSPPLCVGTA